MYLLLTSIFDEVMVELVGMCLSPFSGSQIGRLCHWRLGEVNKTPTGALFGAVRVPDVVAI